MFKKFGLTVMSMLAVVFIFNPIGYASNGETENKTLSPYFLVQSDNPETDRLPLKATSAQVNVAGVIADVTVTQEYQNEGKNPLEAIYVFPASTKAAVYAMKMQIGERTIQAKIKKKQEARQEYEQAKQAGQSASLLEQRRPNVFQMNVANILPGDVIKVEMKYTELLVPTDAVYQFVYPTVVGPRYAGDQFGGDAPSEDWTANPYLHEGEKPLNTFDIKVNLQTGVPVQDITCETHKVNISYEGKTSARVQLDGGEKQGGNRDFILKYRLTGNAIETGGLLYEGEKENFFLLMLQPPKRVKASQIPPREYLFVVDVSGSMRGFPLNTSKALLKDLIGGLNQKDMFNVLLFAGSARMMAENSLPATQANINRAIHTIDRQRGGGGTRLLPALQKAFDLTQAQGMSRTIVVVTDGYVAVEAQAFDLIRKRLSDANLFPFGIGSSVNRHLIEGMARMGMGEPFVVLKPGAAKDKANKLRKLIQTPVLTDVKIDFQGFDTYDVEPPSIPDVMADRPVIVFGKYRGKAKGRIRLQGVSGETPYSTEIDLSVLKPTPTNMALRYLWARHRIAVLADYNQLSPNDERVQEVTNLGLTYNLLTAYTSFVAVDSLKRIKNGKATTVRQPLPLPQGVSDSAVGVIRQMAPQPKSMPRSKAYQAPPGIVKRQLEMTAPTSADRNRREPVIREATKSPSAGKKLDNVDKLYAAAPAEMKEEAEISEERQACVRIGTISIIGAVTQKDIRKQLQALMDDIATCYRRAFGPASKWPQTVIATLEVGADGVRVSFTKANKTKITDKPFTACMTRFFKRINLTPADSKGSARVVVRLVYQK